MIMNNNNNEQTAEKNASLYQRKPVKTFKSDKGYDRVRDRKDKRLYEIDEDGNYGTEEKRPCVF